MILLCLCSVEFSSYPQTHKDRFFITPCVASNSTNLNLTLSSFAFSLSTFSSSYCSYFSWPKALETLLDSQSQNLSCNIFRNSCTLITLYSSQFNRAVLRFPANYIFEFSANYIAINKKWRDFHKEGVFFWGIIVLKEHSQTPTLHPTKTRT